MERNIRTVADVLAMLDEQITTAKPDFWDGFYADRTKDVPFFVEKPDENLVAYLDRGLLEPGRALDIGCGPGRNALYLAAKGFTVDAIDLSQTAIDWARERAGDTGVNFIRGNAFDAGLTGPYDLVYDSGCFHHLAPHRRISYLALLDEVLAPGGHFALTCFDGQEASARPDADFYRDGRLDGGVGYDPDDLRHVFAGYAEVELRRMTEQPADAPHFGAPFLWTALFHRA